MLREVAKFFHTCILCNCRLNTMWRSPRLEACALRNCSPHYTWDPFSCGCFRGSLVSGSRSLRLSRVMGLHAWHLKPLFSPRPLRLLWEEPSRRSLKCFQDFFHTFLDISTWLLFNHTNLISKCLQNSLLVFLTWKCFYFLCHIARMQIFQTLILCFRFTYEFQFYIICSHNWS